MLSLKIDKNDDNNYDFNYCVYSTNESRPSKSLINCNWYKEYNKFDLNLEIFNEFSYNDKKLENLLIREFINVFKLSLFNIEDISLSFDNIIINNLDNFNLVFCLEKKIKLKTIIENFVILLKELENGDNLIINYLNLFTYPSAEFLKVLCNLFSKIKIYYCKLLKQNIIYCINYKNNSHITIYIKNVLKNWNKNSYIRQFGIFLNEEELILIKNHNCFIFNYYIDFNKNLSNSSLIEKEYLYKLYYKKYFKINQDNKECIHEIVNFNMQNCFICKKCSDLFMIY
jgi:hypothetical protein